MAGTGRRWAIAGGAVAVLVVTGVALYLDYIRLPAGYVDPDTIPRKVLEARVAEFQGAANRLTSHVLSKERFDVTFTDGAVNAYITTTLARTGAAWFEHLRLPEDLEHVQVGFTPGGVVLFGRVERGWASCVMSATLRPAVDGNGDLAVRVARVHGGRLRVPRGLAGRFLEALERRPMVIRLADGRRVRLTQVELAAGTLRLVGGPGQE